MDFLLSDVFMFQEHIQSSEISSIEQCGTSGIVVELHRCLDGNSSDGLTSLFSTRQPSTPLHTSSIHFFLLGSTTTLDLLFTFCSFTSLLFHSRLSSLSPGYGYRYKILRYWDFLSSFALMYVHYIDFESSCTTHFLPTYVCTGFAWGMVDTKGQSM